MKEPFLGSTDHLGERELQLETCPCQSEGVEWRAWHFLAQEEVLREAEAFLGGQCCQFLFSQFLISKFLKIDTK